MWRWVGLFLLAQESHHLKDLFVIDPEKEKEVKSKADGSKVSKEVI